MDALAHNLEAYCASNYHPMADGIALEGMWLIKKWLTIAVNEGENLEARGNMLTASSMGAAAFQKGLGAIHSLSHPVGSAYNTHHGLTNAVFMPYVMEFNRIAIEDKMGRLGRYLGLSVANYDGVMTWVLGLRNAFDIPHTAAELGVEERTIVLLESPRRLAATLGDLAGALGGDRSVAVARELTKLHEETWRGTLAGAVDHYVEAPKGEVVIVVAGAPPADEPDDQRVLAVVTEARSGGASTRDAADEAVRRLGVSRRRAYRLALGD